MITPEPMKIRFPLSAKILLWFVLNLVFLGVVLFAFLKIQFHFGLDALLMGQAGERIQAVSQIISSELNETPKARWGSILERFSSAYQVQFVLFHLDGTQAAGETITLPTEVQAKFSERRWPFFQPQPQRQPGAPSVGQPGFRTGPPQEPRPNRPPPNGEKGEERDHHGPPEESRPNRPLPPPQPGVPPFGPQARFMLHTFSPSRYWVFVRIPVFDREMPRLMPVTLLAVSNSIRGGGLFFDFLPWVGVGLGVIFVSVLFWLPLVRGITRSLSQLTHATEQIAEGRFEARVEATRRDELGRLGQAVNRMATRLAGFVTGQKRFLGDIAHELCSPIARIQVALGILEQRADAKQKAYVEDVREEVQHMSSLVNELLSFSKAGLRQKEITLEPVNLADLARRVVAREAADATLIEIQIAETTQALAEPELLSRALANLVRNAIRYAGQSGPIMISALAQDGRVTLTVTDCGPGVPEETMGQIFDPFFRLEASRSRDTGGTGLGLAIVKTCVESCQGTVSAKNRSPSGLQVEIVLKSPPKQA